MSEHMETEDSPQTSGSGERSTPMRFKVEHLIPPSNAEASTSATAASSISEVSETKLEEIRDHFSKEGFDLPITEDGAGSTGSSTESREPLSQREMMFLSKETFQRFLKATKGDVAEAIKRLEAAVIWRRSVKLEDVQAMADDCEPESRTGKNIVMGYDPQHRPIMYFFPNRNKTPVNERRIVHPLFLMERARDLMPAGVSSVVVIFNFAGKREGPPSSVSNARQLLSILGQHYPETLGLSFFQDLPWIVKGFINLMWPFVDPATKKKVKFGSTTTGELTNDGDVHPEQLLKECGGDLHIPYNHDEYWDLMVRTCLDLRQRQEEVFGALEGPLIGREEKHWRVPVSAPAQTLEDDELSTESFATAEGGEPSKPTIFTSSGIVDSSDEVARMSGVPVQTVAA